MTRYGTVRHNTRGAAVNMPCPLRVVLVGASAALLLCAATSQPGVEGPSSLPAKVRIL